MVVIVSFYYFAPSQKWERSIVMSMSVCLFVCPSARMHILITTQPNFTKFFMWTFLNLLVAVSVLFWRHCNTSVCYVLPVLWMTWCFHTMGSMVHRLYASGDSLIAATTASIHTKFWLTTEISKYTSRIAHWGRSLVYTVALFLIAVGSVFYTRSPQLPRFAWCVLGCIVQWSS